MSAKTRFRQGFSIEELQAGAYSDDELEDEEEELDFRGDMSRVDDGNGTTDIQNGSREDDEFLVDETIDAKNEQWVRSHFEKDRKGDEVTICCPSCFTPVSYLSKPQKKTFVANKVVHCAVAPSSDEAKSGDPVTCGECGTDLGIRRNQDRIFVFTNVLPSTTADQL